MASTSYLMVSNITTQEGKKIGEEHNSQTIANIFQVGGLGLPVLVFCQENGINSAGFCKQS